MLSEHLIIKTRPFANHENIVLMGDYRITVLGDCLFRLEKNATHMFNDHATQSVWYRDVAPQHFIVKDNNIITDKVTLRIEDNFDDCRVLLVEKWLPLNNVGALPACCRTLDNTNGSKLVNEDGKNIDLRTGVVSRNGVAVIDDTASLVLDEEGSLISPEQNEKDIYIFAFGRDYRGAIKALYQISGDVPLIPRFAMGNWWSRYYPYTDKQYLHLMDKFEERKIPLTVATVDMDWHYSNDMNDLIHNQKKFIGGKYGTSRGWTGYTWNKRLFPDYKQFLMELHKRGLKVTLNLHPADGVRWFEEQYNEFAASMGMNPEEKVQIPFDISNTNFINHYFSVLHKPYERDGVDFWWIDWQQGKTSAIPGLDPLWSLNHYHYLDNAKNHDIPLILSRFCGVGSQRYPLGFSGDTAITWDTLEFYPYFTASSSNIGYTWWSHDIGGHHNGYKDDELYVRSIEFGVFNPINRLHCTSHEFLTKEPWTYRNGVQYIVEDQMRLRHRMIPFLYSCVWRNHHDGLALVEPLYYDYPDCEEAYIFKTQYLFGGQLLCAPVTHPSIIEDKRLARVNVWLPKGKWTDIFTGAEYQGGRVVEMVRGLESMPVLAKEGGIFVLSDDQKGNSIENPEKLRVEIYNGNGDFELYEDGGFTRFKTAWKDCKQYVTVTFEGNRAVLPAHRLLKCVFKNIPHGQVELLVNGVASAIENDDNEYITVIIDDYCPDNVYTLIVASDEISELERRITRTTEDLKLLEENNQARADFYNQLLQCQTEEEIIAAIKNAPFSDISKTAMLETYDF